MRKSDKKTVMVTASVMDKKEFENVICDKANEPGPTTKLETDKESVWINFQNHNGDYLRVGINPKEAYNIKKVTHDEDGKEVVKEDIKIESGVTCELEKGPNYECSFELPFHLLPSITMDYKFQILHFHRVKTEGGEEKTFTGALCPTTKEDKEFCWKGCNSDKRFFSTDNFKYPDQKEKENKKK